MIKKVNTCPKINNVKVHKKRGNSFGFYALKGNSIISSIGKGNRETMVKMLTLVREANPLAQTILLIWDNHKAT